MSVSDTCKELSFKTEFAACIGKQSGSSPPSSTTAVLLTELVVPGGHQDASSRVSTPTSISSQLETKIHGYEHRRVHHAAKVYVQGDTHTNTIEGFWSLVKRGISGVNHAVSEKYLQSYLNEYSFRYNRREQDQPMFEAFLGQVVAWQ